MTYRTTAEDVAEIMDDLESDVTNERIQSFINAANITLTKIWDDEDVTSDLSEEQAAEVEKWFAAHLIASTIAQQAQEEGTEDANIKYQGKTEMGLDAARYGQMAKILDTTGALASSGMKKAWVKAITSFE